MLIQVKPDEQVSWAFNAKKAWYVGPCFNHYCSFREVLPSTKGEHISDSVKFQHHMIAILELAPADRILEATRQLKDAITQQPTKSPMEELQVIELLPKVILGEHDGPLPSNSVQRAKARGTDPPAPACNTTASPQTSPVNYILDDKDDDVQPEWRRSR